MIGTRALRLYLCLLTMLLATAVTPAQTTLDAPGARQRAAVPRIAPLPEAQWTEVHRQLIDKFAGGKPDTAFRTLLNLPAAVEGMMPYTNYLADESSLSPRHRELLILRTAWLLGNQPLWAKHAPRARQAGLAAADIKRIAQGPEAQGWSPFDATLRERRRSALSQLVDCRCDVEGVGSRLRHVSPDGCGGDCQPVHDPLYGVRLAFGVQPDPATTTGCPPTCDIASPSHHASRRGAARAGNRQDEGSPSVARSGSIKNSPAGASDRVSSSVFRN